MKIRTKETDWAAVGWLSLCAVCFCAGMLVGFDIQERRPTAEEIAAKKARQLETAAVIMDSIAAAYRSAAVIESKAYVQESQQGR